MKKINVALIYDRVNKFGGAEQVLLALHQLFPNAPLYTSVYDKKGAAWAKDFTVIPSFLQRIPFAKKHHEWFAPFMPFVFESFDFSNFDIVISVTSEAAKGIITKPGTLHICYMLTPTRYLWSHEKAYQQESKGIFLRMFSSYLKRWDLVASTRPDVIIPISAHIKERVQKYYKRVCLPVIYPPVQVERYVMTKQSQKKYSYEYDVIVSRLVPYKRIDLAIEAAIQNKTHLHIIGEGSDRERLEDIAGNSKYIHFLGKLSDEHVYDQLQAAFSFLSPADEDFGIAAVEALACGKPVICFASSGTAETIVDGQTGVAFLNQTRLDVSRAMIRSHTIQWDADYIKQSVQKFGQDNFIKQWSNVVKDLWKNT